MENDEVGTDEESSKTLKYV